MVLANEKARSVLHLSGNKDRGRKTFLQQHPEGINVIKKKWLLEGLCQGAQQTYFRKRLKR